MKVSYLRQYRHRTSGNPVFVYIVKGTEKELEQYAEAQGENLVIDKQTGNVLWFTTNFIGDSGKLIITDAGRVIPDLGDFAKAQSLANQFEGPLGDKIAEKMAEKLLGSMGKEVEAERVETPAEPKNLDK